MLLPSRPVLAAGLFGALAVCLGPTAWAQQDQPPWQAPAPGGPLPHWPAGGPLPDDPGRSLLPRTLRAGVPGEGDPSAGRMPPGSGLLASPTEYEPSDGLILRFDEAEMADFVTRCVAALTGDAGGDARAWVIVEDAAQQALASTRFTAAGADLARVVFVMLPSDSVWVRDYGPHFIWQDGALGIVDSLYFEGRPLDSYIPTLLAQAPFVVPAWCMGLFYSGGNFMPGPARSAFVTSLVTQENPGLDEATIVALYHDFQGIDTLHVMPRLPFAADPSGHVDMWMYVVDADDVVVSEFRPGADPTAIQITENAVPYLQALGFSVHRVPTWNVGYTLYTYTNAARVSDRILVPVYGATNPAYLDEDQQALAAWAAAAGPSVQIVPVDSGDIIGLGGAVHCTVMQVPRVTDPLPAAHLVSPHGGELLVAGTPHEIRWAASDDVGVTGVDLSLSTDGGATFPQLLATNEPHDGRFDWLVPDLESETALVRVQARDGDGNVTDAVSAAPLELAWAPQHVYDFSVGAGIDRWAWGASTQGWGAVDSVRKPATASTPVEVLQPGAYARLAHADASGGDGDPNRYIAPQPAMNWESTHVFAFELAEDPATLLDLGLRWEGYADACTQVELYVWDVLAGNWGDGTGQVGENHYLANLAANGDGLLEGHLRGDFSRHVDVRGLLHLLVYVEADWQRSFHDHVSLTATYRLCQEDLGYGGPGAVALSVCGEDLTQAGSSARLTLAAAPPAAPVFLFAGSSFGPTPTHGGTLVPVPWWLLLDALVTDVQGALALDVPGAGGAPVTVYLQAVVPLGGGFAFSNALAVELGSG